ncbi:MAG: AraC family transcriptional regulator [Clostridiales bacterium]|nr:AraC family transcriptional regulator [Clostridiales bacterium]
MNHPYHKILTTLKDDVVCECKTFSTPIDPRHCLHCHDGYEILLVLSGSLRFYSEGDGKTLGHGDLVCVDAHEFHHGVLLTPNVYDRVVINIRESALNHYSSPDTDFSICFRHTQAGKISLTHLNEQECDTFLEYSKALEQALTRSHFGDDILIEAYVKLLLVLVSRSLPSFSEAQSTNIMPDLVSRTFAYIDNHLTEDLSLQKLSEELHYNEIYLSRCFRKIACTSLQQYIIAKRVTLAQKLLREGNSPYDVCFQSGFNNYSNFSRTFSKQTGISPKQYQLDSLSERSNSAH